MSRGWTLFWSLVAVTLGIVVVAAGTGTFHASYVVLGLVFYAAVIVGFLTLGRRGRGWLDRQRSDG